ncbi:hypothetical protein L1049_011923 [Liquidambar formosana]|uniref:Uncharacterized protein n=1 Tax=Liquidambar formosana TaxID=63359 RepID=A0AAP0X2Q4_LIQFO
MVHSNRQARGIALLWDSATEVDLMSYSQIYIGVQVNEGGQPKRRLTGFYGHSEVSQKVLSWNLLCWLSKNSSLPWVTNEMNATLLRYFHADEDLGLRDIMMEGDNLEVITSITADEEDPSSIGLLIEDIKI